MLRSLLAVAVCTVLAVSAKAAEVRGVTDSEIAIGSYTDLSGVTAVWGVNNNNAWRMMFDAVNEAGGINGRKIKFITEDNQYQVPRSVQAANKLVNLDKVLLLIANGGTPMNNAVLPMLIEKGVPNVFPLTSARSMYEPLNKYKFGLASSYYDQIRAGVKYFVDKRNKTRVCAAAQDTDFGRDVTDGVKDQLKAMDGKATLVGETGHKPTDTDFTSAVAKLRDSKCDLVVLGTIVRDAIQFISAVRKAGWDVDMLGQAATYDSAVAEFPGGATEGVYTMTPVLFVANDDPRPEVQAFAKKYKELFKKEPNFAAQIGYTGAQVMMAGLQNAGKDLNADTFVTGLEAVKNYKDIFGSPPMSFSATKHQGSNESFLTRVEKGKWVPVSKEPMGY